MKQIGIIEVTYTNYTEREIVYKGSNLSDITSCSDYVSHEVIEGTDGSEQPQYVEMTQYKFGHPIISGDMFHVDLDNDKVKYAGDTCGSFAPRWQKLRQSGLGQYIILYGERWYLDI